MVRRCLLVVVLVLMLHESAYAGVDCTEYLLDVSFGELSVEPELPVVGDELTLRFDVTAGGFFPAPSPDLEAEVLGAEELLEGIRMDSHFFRSNVTFTFPLTAVRSGGAELRLEVTYESALGCVDADGIYSLEPGRSVHVLSPPYGLEILEPTPRPTPTATPQPTANPDRGGGGGCQVLGEDGAGGAAVFFLPLVLAVVGLRRRFHPLRIGRRVYLRAQRVQPRD